MAVDRRLSPAAWMPALFGLLGLALSACAGTPAGSNLVVTFSHLQPIRFNATEVQFVDNYRPTLAPPNVEHQYPQTPASAVRDWTRARIAAGPPRNRASRSAPLASIHIEAQSVDAEPSQPSPTLTPASRISRTGARPPPINWLLLGQCATPVPQRASRPDAVRDPAPVAAPTDVLEVLERTLAQRRQAVFVLVSSLGDVRVQPDIESLGELCRAAHQGRCH